MCTGAGNTQHIRARAHIYRRLRTWIVITQLRMARIHGVDDIQTAAVGEVNEVAAPSGSQRKMGWLVSAGREAGISQTQPAEFAYTKRRALNLYECETEAGADQMRRNHGTCAICAQRNIGLPASEIRGDNSCAKAAVGVVFAQG